MPPSYRSVNFKLRPSKAVERKMIIESCERMNVFADLHTFRYIGLGSPFFNDFSSIHRRYDITKMVCIEREYQDEDRFLFNRPFDCIDMQWGESTEILPTLPWKGIPTIVWMDYDDPISEGVLADIGTIFGELEPGSMALFTIQAYGKSFETNKESAFEGFEEGYR